MLKLVFKFILCYNFVVYECILIQANLLRCIVTFFIRQNIWYNIMKKLKINIQIEKKYLVKTIPPSVRPKILTTQHQMLKGAIYIGFDSIWYHYEHIKRDKREKPTVPFYLIIKLNSFQSNKIG